MVQPRPKRIRPTRLKRAMQRYIKAMRRAAFVRKAIDWIDEVREKRPGGEEDAASYLPRWARRMALDGAPPPEPDIWSFYWRGKGQKNLGPPTPPASAAPDTPPSSPHSPRRRRKPGSRGSGRGCP